MPQGSLPASQNKRGSIVNFSVSFLQAVQTYQFKEDSVDFLTGMLFAVYVAVLVLTSHLEFVWYF